MKKGTSMRIIAEVTEVSGGPFVLSDLELGELRDDEVLVDVNAAGICQTELICRDQWIPVPLPGVLGHEGAGVVRAVGAAVTKIHVGERVAADTQAGRTLKPVLRMSS